ncbi:hypothetical protein [Burkholderia gladioli]|uniref:hypothetical protein n=1 Tax=Burkholderia gladioli TaxID=28095 RepID=UPI000D00935A|nr:hypothetical protein [Burkholderia gladioli]MBU9190839.1 hypothetical protein [Burkholderia gladioli]MBU9277577.1 hypothetical protein [Burkholderia gladioli]MBU9687179.1 hypothetical protein [Burkholderia gladioli]PRE13761.1 hypothetical protein C6P72_29685 [Burkholderia gladioli]
MKSSRDFHDNYPQAKAVCQNVTKLLTMREQALAPIATLQRTTAGTLSSNGVRLTLACVGIDLAMAIARRQLGIDAGQGDDGVILADE